MSDRAMDYVSNLGPERVTFAQKHVLLQIARHCSDRYGTANVALDTLCSDLSRTRGHLARVFKSLGHVLDYKPGRGSGNFSEFRFIELESERAAERLHKGSIFEIAIRKDLNPDQNQNPPCPPFSKGGTALSDRELSRIRRRFSSLVRAEERRPSEGFASNGPSYEDLARRACLLELIEVERALPVIKAIWEGGSRKPETKKEPQRATA